MKPTPELLDNRRRLNRAIGIALLAGGIFALVALLTYHGTDRPFFFGGGRAGAATRNLFGRAGATVGEALLQTLGVAAFLFSAFCAWLGWDRIRRWDERALGRTLTYGLIVLTLCSLLDLFFGEVALRGSGALPAGGFLGSWLAGAERAVVGPLGAWLVSSAVLATVVILGWRESFSRTAQLLGARLAGRGEALSARWAAYRGARAARRKAEAGRPAPPRVASGKGGDEGPEPADDAPAPPRPRPPIRLAADKPAAEERAPARPLQVIPRAAAEKPADRPAAAAAPRQQSLPMAPGERKYTLPPIDLLNDPEPQTIESEQELLDRAQLITEKLQEFAVGGSVVAVHPGPVVTTFEFKPDAGVKYSKITSMNDDLSLALKAESVRIDRMPGRSTVGIEVPNRRQETIFPKDLMRSKKFIDSRSRLTLALGKDITGGVFTADLDRMPHLMIAGATGAGKSVGLNGMITSLLYKATPDDLRMIMIDTKMIELGIYADIPHLLIPVVTQPKQASAALKWGVKEMEQRYRKLAAVGVRNLAQYNDLVKKEPDRTVPDPKTGEPVRMKHLPYIVIVIDEMADLMMISGAEVEESIMRLAQMARAVGIHLILATQRPSVDVITGTIKANFPSRIAFRVSQRVDSRTIIDQQGAEHLLGRGDMLFLATGSARVVRLHGGFITEAELHRITSWLKKMAQPVYDESVLKEAADAAAGAEDGERDEMYADAVRTVINEGKCSITLIQRRLQLGYARAARIVDVMEREGVVSPGEGSKPRDILVGPEVLETLDAHPHS